MHREAKKKNMKNVAGEQRRGETEQQILHCAFKAAAPLSWFEGIKVESDDLNIRES